MPNFNAENYQKARDAGYTDAEISAFVKNFAPGVDKPGLPVSRPEFQGMDYGSELPIPSDNFATRGAAQMASGAAKMTRPGMSPKFGGASDIFRGAATVASPVLAAALPVAVAAAPTATGAGLLAGYGGGGIAKNAAQRMGADENVQNFSEDLGGLLAGAGGAYLGHRGAAAVSSIRHKFADPNVRDALVRTLPKGRDALKLRDAWAAADAPTPTPVVRPASDGTLGIRNFDVGAPRPTPTPSNVSWQSGTSGKPGGLLAPEPKPTPAELIARDKQQLANIEAFKAKKAAKAEGLMDTPKPTPKPTAPSENAAARMKAQDAAGQPRTGLISDVAAEAEKRGAWNVNAGNKGEMLTKLKQEALIQFADANNLPKVNMTEPEYNALVTAFNQTNPVHPVSGKPWKISPAGANNSATGYGRDVETTLRHFNNMRLGKK